MYDLKSILHFIPTRRDTNNITVTINLLVCFMFIKAARKKALECGNILQIKKESDMIENILQANFEGNIYLKAN